MVIRHPVTEYEPTRTTSSESEGPKPDVEEVSEARVIPLHGSSRDTGSERGGALATGPKGATSASKPDEYGPRADADVVRFPGRGVTRPQLRPAPPVTELPGLPELGGSYEDLLPAPVSKALDFVRERLTGDYTVDEFGFDAELTDTVLMPALRLLYDKWFRVTTHGTGNLPEVGGALLVFNHSGTIPLDALMASVAVNNELPKRHLRLLGADLVFQVPFLGELARKAGHTLACHEDAERLLRGGEVVGVFPEGFKGVGKPYSSRYKLQRFGRGGFVSAAVRTGVPIIPCAIVGAEETYPMLGNIKPLARLLGLPYFPITPLFPLLGPLGAIPMPSKWHIEFGTPVRTDLVDAEEADPMMVLGLTDQVRESVQQMLYERLADRKGTYRD